MLFSTFAPKSGSRDLWKLWDALGELWEVPSELWDCLGEPWDGLGDLRDSPESIYKLPINTL